MTTLNVLTNAGLVTINWDNSQFLEQYAICQNPVKFRALNVTPNFTFEKCLNWWDKEWNDLAKLNLFDLSYVFIIIIKNKKQKRIIIILVK